MGVVDSSSQVVCFVPYSSHSSASAWGPCSRMQSCMSASPRRSQVVPEKNSPTCAPLHRLQLPSGCFHLFHHGVLLGLQMEIWCTMDHHGLQGNNLHSHELCRGLQRKLYSSLPLLNWPWCLQSFFPHIYSLLSHSLLLCSVLNPFPIYIITDPISISLII